MRLFGPDEKQELVQCAEFVGGPADGDLQFVSVIHPPDVIQLGDANYKRDWSSPFPIYVWQNPK